MPFGPWPGGSGGGGGGFPGFGGAPPQVAAASAAGATGLASDAGHTHKAAALAVVYNVGAGVADQTLTLTDARGRLVIDGSALTDLVGAVTIKGTGGLTGPPLRLETGDISGIGMTLRTGASTINSDAAGGLDLSGLLVSLDGTSGRGFQLDASNNLALGFQNTLAAAAVNGFPFIRSMTAKPTGVPASVYSTVAAMVPEVWDSGGKLVWFFDLPSASWVAPAPQIVLAGIATGATQLSTLPSASHRDGTLAYVLSVGDVFRLQVSAATVDGITVVAATGKAGYQWARLLQPVPTNGNVITWSVDPVNGNDENAGTGATAAASDLLAVKTLQEIKRRLWGLEIKVATVTVRMLNSMPATDVGVWNTQFFQGGLFQIQGQLGAVTGPGPTAIDNTLYTGSLTSAPTVPADVPTADDYEITDTAIPVSYTASGLLAAGVLFQRTNGAARYWWPLKDLGAKTLRVTAPMASLTALTTWGGGAMANGDTYKAFQLRDFYNQDFGPGSVGVRIEQLYDRIAASANLAEGIGRSAQRLRVDCGGTDPLQLGTQWTNCLIRLAGSRNVSNATGSSGSLIGGGAIGTGATVLNFFGGTYVVAGCWVAQGVAIGANDRGSVQFEREFAIHDTTVAMLQPQTPGCLIAIMCATAGQGMSGKGNTGKLVIASIGGGVYYGFSGAAPPFIAGLTTDATPITIGGTSYTVAQCPVVGDTMLSPTVYKATLP